MKQTYTHKGWFYLCPVYLNADKGEGMEVAARWSILDSWLDLNMTLFDFAALFSPYVEPFPFKVTGKLKMPIELKVKE